MYMCSCPLCASTPHIPAVSGQQEKKMIELNEIESKYL